MAVLGAEVQMHSWGQSFYMSALRWHILMGRWVTKPTGSGEVKMATSELFSKGP